jgi:DNA-binding XRE family transcriptional regulator
MEVEMENIIEGIRIERHRRKLTQEQVDTGAGVGKRTMQKFEKGQIRNVVIIEKIVKFFGYKLDIVKNNI